MLRIYLSIFVSVVWSWLLLSPSLPFWLIVCEWILCFLTTISRFNHLGRRERVREGREERRKRKDIHCSAAFNNNRDNNGARETEEVKERKKRREKKGAEIVLCRLDCSNILCFEAFFPPILYLSWFLVIASLADWALSEKKKRKTGSVNDETKMNRSKRSIEKEVRVNERKVWTLPVKVHCVFILVLHSCDQAILLLFCSSFLSSSSSFYLKA